jgi:glycosyltransferase involved in cell wall biosynthesis
VSARPLLSIVVPAHQAALHLPESLGALAGSDLGREQWELIVVDDASTDGTSDIAESFADRVLSLPGPPRGPGNARNVGAEAAVGAWLVFIDADVLVHRDTLRNFTETMARQPEAVAIFGTYDARPRARSLVSEYRNLLHRHVHLQGAGDAETFWAGCGAVRRDWFLAAGGFDAQKYPKPQIEDIDLGYRLRARGGRIVLDPAIEVTHLKRWSVGAMIRTDIRDRGIPWVRLLLERRGRSRRSLNVGRAEPFKVALAGTALASVPLGALTGSRLGLAVLPVGAVLLTAWNLETFRWFAGQRGNRFAASVVPLHLLHYACIVVAATAGVGAHAWSLIPPRARR